MSPATLDARALFVRNDAGRVVEVVLISSGQATRARRVDPPREDGAVTSGAR